VASFLLDHNVSPRLAALLRRAGHAAQTVRDVQLDAATDAEILRIAGRAGLIVLTADDDFAGLHSDGTIEHAGILLIPQPRQENAASIVAAIVQLSASGAPAPGELYRLSEEGEWLSG
jgi:hypothetical protein